MPLATVVGQSGQVFLLDISAAISFRALRRKADCRGGIAAELCNTAEFLEGHE
jgi:hypothetical protein